MPTKMLTAARQVLWQLPREITDVPGPQNGLELQLSPEFCKWAAELLN